MASQAKRSSAMPPSHITTRAAPWARSDSGASILLRFRLRGFFFIIWRGLLRGLDEKQNVIVMADVFHPARLRDGVEHFSNCLHRLFGFLLSETTLGHDLFSFVLFQNLGGHAVAGADELESPGNPKLAVMCSD